MLAKRKKQGKALPTSINPFSISKKSAQVLKAGIAIDQKLEEELHAEAMRILGKKRSKHGKKMAKRIKRAEAHEIVYDRVLIKSEANESMTETAK